MSWLIEHADWLQWPAMVVTLVATWLVGSNAKPRRHAGFWLYVASNVLWTAWGVASHAYALIVLQVGLLILNVRGMRKTDT